MQLLLRHPFRLRRPGVNFRDGHGAVVGLQKELRKRRLAQRRKGLGRCERAFAEREAVTFRQGLPRLLGRADEAVENHGPGFRGRQFAHQRLEGPDAVEHHGKSPLAGQPQLRPQCGQLGRTVGASHEIQSRFAHGLRPAETLAERCGVLRRGVPRVHARRAEFDPRTGRAMGVYVDVREHPDCKCRNFSGSIANLEPIF